MAGVDIVRRMTRRIIATALWAYFGWFLAATVLSVLGLPTAISPVGGILMAGVALVDWRRFLAQAKQVDDRVSQSHVRQ